MANKTRKQRRQQAREEAKQAKRGGAASGASPSLVMAGLAMLAVAIFASGMLVWQHFTAGSLPGCGPGSACAEATSSAWGRVPLVNWPVSFLGLAYFVGLAAAWIAAPRAGLGALPWVVRLGAVFSIVYVIVMVAGGMLCPYCLATHAANLAFLVVMETVRQQSRATSSAPLLGVPVQRLAIGFIAASVVLGGWQFQFHQSNQQRAEQELEESTAEVIAASANNAGGDERDRGFTGRYLYGPEEAPIRLVMFSDYQCIDCQRVEGEVERLLNSRDDVSLSVKHFPMDSKCNPHISREMHPNACLAAKAVEAAGILGGSDRFWEMHWWMFQRKGTFTEGQLRAALQQMGWTNPDEFIRVMHGQEAAQRVLADIEEGKSLGLMYTPMVFINGVELRGWTRPNGLTQAVQSLAATNPPPKAVDEQPPSAFEKYINDWRENVPRTMSPASAARSTGPANARLRIVMFGDYSEQRVAEADAEVRRLIADHDSARYSFRHYPANPECNPHMPRAIYDDSCWAHRAAEAAAIIGGSDGFWRMHAWLLENQSNFNDRALQRAAPNLGFDANAILEMMSSPQVEAALQTDADEGNRQRLRSVPMLFVNERWVPRWHLDGHEVLATIIEEAGR